MMDIVYITDENYIMPTAVSITSLVTNSKTQLNVYVICNNIDYKTGVLKDIKTDNSCISIIDVKGKYDFDEIVKQSKNKRRISEAALLKFFIPDILKDHRKVMFIDGDTLIMKDLSDLYETDLSDFYIAAVKDPAKYTMPKRFKEGVYTKGIDTVNGEFFNSGVMVMDLQRMRSEGIPQKALEKRMIYDDPLMDQGTLNHVLCGKWKEIPNRYNFLTRTVELYDVVDINKIYGTSYTTCRELLEDQSILHFAGDEKPWLYDIPYVSDIFNHYYSLTPYNKDKLELHSLIVERNRELERVNELYIELFNKTEFIRRPKNAIKKIFNK